MRALLAWLPAMILQLLGHRVVRSWRVGSVRHVVCGRCRSEVTHEPRMVRRADWPHPTDPHVTGDCPAARLWRWSRR